MMIKRCPFFHKAIVVNRRQEAWPLSRLVVQLADLVKPKIASSLS